MKRVVLVRTQGPRNAGGILRSVANFGPAELWFVAPDKPSLLIHPEFEQMSHGVENIAERVVVVDTLHEALADCQRVVGFTARARGDRIRKVWHEYGSELQGPANGSSERLALVFGSEENGLTKEEIDLCEESVHIRTSTEHTSLNLALSVGIVLHDLFDAEAAEVLEPGGYRADGATREFLKAHLKHVFGGSIARSDGARRDIIESIERLFSRAPLETRDARAWHLMLRAMGSNKRPADFGIEWGSRAADDPE